VNCRTIRGVRHNRNSVETVRILRILLNSALRVTDACQPFHKYSTLQKEKTEGRLIDAKSKSRAKTMVDSNSVALETVVEVRRAEVLLKARALQDAIFNSGNFSSIATD
jgi:hypothetical protein